MSPIRRPALAAALAGGLALAALAGCGGGSGFDSTASSSGAIKVLIGSSGDAETAAVKKAVAAWSKQTGKKASVSVANDLAQQLSQGFASGKPPDLFYVSTDQLAGYAGNGSLYAYGDKLSDTGDFYPNLVQAFTVDKKLYCAPKDFSTLQLVINTEMWQKAGLTDADVPTTWDQLDAVAKKLAASSGAKAGLTFSPEYARIGSFMAQAGGGMTNADQTEATVDSSANVTALDYVKKLLTDGAAAYSSTLGAGWGGEAFGKGLAAMTIEGNWLIGAMASDYPDVKYRVVALPAGPKGPGTLAFTNCWGIAAKSGHKSDTVKLVDYLTTAQQQIRFADEFGVIPSVKSAAEQWQQQQPGYAPFIAGADYAQNTPSTQGSADVVSDFNSQLETLAKSDPKTILASVQKSLAATMTQ
ncbi:extracellular solute-binding protein [Nocardioides mangrovicus]|uniref:Extracellular solute-binding protein n=1 Tax=Nocardioides mangrovicus TaxID=2478913 RepID=A0A3L8P4H0_9ACTN|nr:extracellular solute-binding protein [Nocardioides mangrovicus]RLV50031.1 extracellular solute-binding protein [Nocardioides mangrovicus]